MPASWNLARATGIWDVQDIERFSRMPVWMANQQVQDLPYWERWGKLLGSIPWQANMGDILQGVIAELPPVNTQKHTPRNITEVPLKTVATHFERGNSARIKRHLFESPLMHFLPSYRDFRKNQIPFAAKALNKIVGVGADMFYRWQILQQSKRIYVPGAAAVSGDGAPLYDVSANAGEATDTSEPKNASFFATYGAKAGNNLDGYLGFRQLVAIRDTCQRDIGMIPWSGVPALPKENEIMKGKWILVGEPAIYDGLMFDSHVLNFKELSRDLLNSPFKGMVAGNIAFLEEAFPLFFNETGAFPEPELEENLGTTLPSGNTKGHETIPNPAYVNAPFGIAFMLGFEPYQTIKIGPPPSEFSSGSISAGKFNKLNWNGEVRITDNVLVNYNGTYDTNKYGEFVQFICDTVLGIIPKTPRHVLPIIYRRVKRPSLVLPPNLT